MIIVKIKFYVISSLIYDKYFYLEFLNRNLRRIFCLAKVILSNKLIMRSDEPVLMQPRTKKSVRIAPKHIENIIGNDVIRNPPKPKDQSFSSYSNIKPKIIIPPRKFAGYVDLANEVRFNKSNYDIRMLTFDRIKFV